MENPSDPFSFLRSGWPGIGASGFAQMPAAAMPTMDLEDLDKRISDLKAVDQWLSLNLQLLKSTIQGMEIKRGTLAQLQAMQSSMQAPSGETGHPAGMLWANLQNQFSQMVAAAQAGTAPSEAAPQATSQAPQAKPSRGPTKPRRTRARPASL